MTNRFVRFILAAVVAAIVLGWVAAGFAKQADKEKDDRGPLSKITFIHYRKGHAKPPWAGGGGSGGGSGVYSYLANGVKWKTTEDMLLNPVCAENAGGTLNAVIENALYAALGTWESAGEKSLTIFGGVSIDESVTYNDGAYRNYNTVSFGPCDDPDIIAVTSVWGYFSGKPATREIVEAHILMNEAYQWGNALADTSVMDIQNIFTHEVGHWAGMGDVYEVTATEETMYGYSTEGETKKRDLYYGDITGVTALYR